MDLQRGRTMEESPFLRVCMFNLHVKSTLKSTVGVPCRSLSFFDAFHLISPARMRYCRHPLLLSTEGANHSPVRRRPYTGPA